MATEPLNSTARAAMEKLNAEADRSGLHIWLRTQANAPAQRPWFRDGGLQPGGELAKGRVGANQMRAAPYHWGGQELGPDPDRIGELARAGVTRRDVHPTEWPDRAHSRAPARGH